MRAYGNIAEGPCLTGRGCREHEALVRDDGTQRATLNHCVVERGGVCIARRRGRLTATATQPISNNDTETQLQQQPTSEAACPPSRPEALNVCATTMMMMLMLMMLMMLMMLKQMSTILDIVLLYNSDDGATAPAAAADSARLRFRVVVAVDAKGE